MAPERMHRWPRSRFAIIAWFPARPLTPDQDKARSRRSAPRWDSSRAWLLLGITGSGKTEVYLRLIDARSARAADRRCCWCRRSTSRRSWRPGWARAFPEPCWLSLHSGVPGGRAPAPLARSRVGQARIVIGTRLGRVHADCPGSA